ncbi:hypothetical protein KIN20_001570 [Parelaphostrongylus tenuis]|uniref:Uncharacterized protein n=1 Tax=Parelaphostrongylus tenuis TaxID=148309 RepID=A0AAD5MFF0_PARTN|nr:hypothetical protein KIN20_001570 [Parelaphostrongylus tenuis]
MYASILDRTVDDLRAVLEFYGVGLSIQLIHDSMFRVNLRLRCGTVHQLFLDIASLLVQRSLLNVLATVLNAALYQDLSSRLNHRSISNRVDFETPRIVALSDTSSEVDVVEFSRGGNC